MDHGRPAHARVSNYIRVSHALEETTHSKGHLHEFCRCPRPVSILVMKWVRGSSCLLELPQTSGSSSYPCLFESSRQGLPYRSYAVGVAAVVFVSYVPISAGTGEDYHAS